MATLDGSAVTGVRAYDTYPVDSPGAHMGLTIHLARFAGDSEGSVLIGPVHLECTSSETNPRPYLWRCNGRLDATIQLEGPLGYIFGLSSPFELHRVDATKVPACSVVQDGDGFPYIPPIGTPD
jgi:hypothetical protein